MKRKKCTTLLLSAVLAASLLAGCGLYAYDDEEDPAGAGTSSTLGEAGTAALTEVYHDALAQTGLQAGEDQRIQGALNQALDRRTASGTSAAALARALRTSLRRAGLDAAVYDTMPALLASDAETACCVFLTQTVPGGSATDAVIIAGALEQMRAANTEDVACRFYLSVEDRRDGKAAYAILLVRS